MTILKITVEDEQADLLRNLLKEVSFVKSIEEESTFLFTQPNNSESAYCRIKRILDDAKGKNLFKDIEDPSEWQREIRGEWERDF